MLNLRCEKDETGIWISYVNKKSQCFTTERSVLLVGNIIALILLILMSTVYRICIYENKISPKSHFAQLNSVFTSSFHISRVLLMILFIPIPDVFFDSIYNE